MKNSKIKLLFIFKGSICANSAPVNRILTLAKGLALEGYQIYIYSILPAKVTDSFVRKEGQIISISPSSSNYLFDKIVVIYSLLFILPIIFVKIKAQLVYSYGDSIIQTLYLRLLRVFFRFKLVKENNEYPLLLIRKHSNLFLPFIKLIVKFSYKSLDGLIVISEKLQNYYKPLLSKYSKIVIINMTVDFSRFENIGLNSPLPNNFTITYCGSFSQTKDGIHFLIEAFSKVLKTNQDIKLVLIGSGNIEENNSLKSLIRKLNIEDSVITTGRLSKDLVPLYLTHSKLLVLPRPSSLQADGGFPTKLGEYLATGNPVIVTNVGEISKFLENQKSAFIVDPNSIESIAEALSRVVNNYSYSLSIGLEGKRIAKKYFSIESQSNRLKEFLDSLI